MAVRWWTLALCLTASLAWTVSRLAALRVRVEGGSMAPTLLDGDRVLVSRLTYRRRAPAAGEIALARLPHVPGGLVIKRVAGRAETPRCGGGHPHPQAGALRSTEEFVLLGDDPAASTDSRHFGPVRREWLVGKVWYRYWPPDRRGPLGPLTGVTGCSG